MPRSATLSGTTPPAPSVRWESPEQRAACNQQSNRDWWRRSIAVRGGLAEIRQTGLVVHWTFTESMALTADAHNPRVAGSCPATRVVSRDIGKDPHHQRGSDPLFEGPSGKARSVVEMAEVPSLVVLDGVEQLLTGVHHERSVSSHRFADRLAGHHECSSTAAGGEFDAVVFGLAAVEDCQLTRGQLDRVDGHVAVDDEHGDVVRQHRCRVRSLPLH